MLLASLALAADPDGFTWIETLKDVGWVAGSVVQVRAEAAPESPAVARLLGGTRVDVVREQGGVVEIRSGKVHGFVARKLLTPAGGRYDADGDGVDERVAVSLDGDVLSLWYRDGEHVKVRTLSTGHEGAVQFSVVDAGRRLLRVDLTVDACDGKPTVWYTADAAGFREVLRVVNWADSGGGHAHTVTFEADRAEVVLDDWVNADIDTVARRTLTTRTCVWDGRTYVCGASRKSP